MKISILPLFLFFILIFTTHIYGHGMNDTEKELILEGSNLNYIFIGITHMITGYDHLLFILGVVFLLKSFKEIIKYVSAFTFGHSITLILATFNSISINYYLIDAFVALSVCFIGLKNLGSFDLYLKNINMYLLIFIFGLIHGLGLSTRLQELSLSKDELLLNILSFNLGIEVGQILVLALFLILINLLAKKLSLKVFSKIINILIILAGIYFFIFQINEYINNSNINTKKVQVLIKAHSDKEYKVWLEKGKRLEYSWYTKGSKIYYDFHGEPSYDTSGYFKSYKEGTSKEVKGKLIAPFMGTHGWYWKNSSSKDILIYLKIKGEYKK